MRVRFTKAPSAAEPDRLTLISKAGTERSIEMPREGVLARVIVQFVVERTLGWRAGYFGQFARAEPTADAEKPGVQASQSAAVAECLQAEQWGGATGDDVFRTRLAKACRSRNVGVPTISAEELARLRMVVREFGAAWRPLQAGASLEREWLEA